MRQHQQAFAGARWWSLSPLQLTICGRFVEACAKEGVTSPESVEPVESMWPMFTRNFTPPFTVSATSNYREGVNPELPLVVMKGAQRECASLSGFFKVVLCVEGHTNVNSGSSLWLRINHKRPADQPNSLLHARKTQTSLSPCCFNVESSA